MSYINLRLLKTRSVSTFVVPQALNCRLATRRPWWMWTNNCSGIFHGSI